MIKYNLSQCIKALEKLFERGVDSEKKIKNLKWEDLNEFAPIEKSLVMDLKIAVSKRKLIEFLAGKEFDVEGKDSDARIL